MEWLELEREQLVGLDLEREHVVGRRLARRDLGLGRRRVPGTGTGTWYLVHVRRRRSACESASRMRAVVLLFAVAACVSVSSVQASNSIKYGIQDDAWLEFGPGKLNQRVETLKRLGVPLVRFTLHWN